MRTYVPQGTGHVSNGSGNCSMQLAKVMEFKLDGDASLFMAADLPAGENPTGSLDLWIYLHPLQTAHFETQSVAVTTDETRQTNLIPFSASSVTYDGSAPDGGPPRRENIASIEIMDGGPLGGGVNIRNTRYDFQINLPFDHPQNFTATLPALLFGQRRVVIDPVHFSLTRGGRVLGVLCS